MTQTQLVKWANQRIADAPKIAKTYERQGHAILDWITDKGCTCNPSYTAQDGDDGAPVLATLQISHALDCPIGSK